LSFLLTSVIASDFVVIKIGLSCGTPLTFAGLRYLIGGIILLLAVAVSRFRFINYSSRNNTYIAFILGIIASIEFSFLYIGMQYTDAGTASLLYNTQPIMVSIMATFFLREPFTPEKFGAVITGFIGVLLIFVENLSSDIATIGSIFILLSAFSWALNTIIFKKMIKDEFIMQTTCIMLLSAGIFLALIGAFFEEIPVFTTKYIATLLYLAVVGSAFGVTLWFYLVTQYGASQTSICLFLVPVFSILLGYLILGENIHLTDILGIFLVGMSIYILNKPFLKRSLGSNQGWKGYKYCPQLKGITEDGK